MDLDEFKLHNLGMEKNKFGRIYSFVDFGNVNYWYERDERDGGDDVLREGEKLVVGVEKLCDFAKLFSAHSRFYFGMDTENKKSIYIIKKARSCFDRTITKPIQRIKHYLTKKDCFGNTRAVNQDHGGQFVYIPKCNFDVEIAVDVFRLIDEFDTLCLFSGDADFAYLLEFLKRKNKQIILFSAGYVSHDLRERASLNVNAQKIKKYITFVKQKPRLFGARF